MRRDGARLQVFWECGHYLRRYRACPSDTKETILVWARPISQFRVTKANLGSSTRIVSQLVNLNVPIPPLGGFGCRFECPLMHRFLPGRGHNFGKLFLTIVGWRASTEPTIVFDLMVHAAGQCAAAGSRAKARVGECRLKPPQRIVRNPSR